MNALLEKVINARKGHYCHVVEVSDVYGLECIAEAIMSENESEFDTETIIGFLETLSVYCLDDTNEAEVYSFNFRDYVNNSLV